MFIIKEYLCYIGKVFAQTKVPNETKRKAQIFVIFFAHSFISNENLFLLKHSYIIQVNPQSAEAEKRRLHASKTANKSG
jgi:hypothetical protein